jgi:hypothetical protein
MKARATWMLSGIALFGIAGCAGSGYGPTYSPMYRQKVTASLPDQTGKIKMMGPAEWYPNTQGFNDLGGSLLTTGTGWVRGILVITERDILLLQWNRRQERYRIMKVIPLEKMKEVSLDSFGLNRRIVIQEEDYTFHSFTFLKLGGQLFIDSSKTESGFQIINQLVGRLNVRLQQE